MFNFGSATSSPFGGLPKANGFSMNNNNHHTDYIDNSTTETKNDTRTNCIKKSDDKIMNEIVLPDKYNHYMETESPDEKFEIDEKTQLPLTSLPYDDAPISKNNMDWLKNGRNLKFSLDKANDSGLLFLSSSKKDEDDLKKTTKIQTEREEKLYPFDLPTNLDTSKAYVHFLEQVFNDFEPLLSNQAYKTYYQDEDDEYLNIGLISKIEENAEQKKTFLQGLMNSVIGNLNDLISTQLKSTNQTSDSFLFNYEETLNILNLFNALYFSKPDERITLFTIWVNRASIQPDESLAQEAMLSDEKPYMNFLFWSTYLKKLIMRGYFNDALQALDNSGYEELQESDPILFNLIQDFKYLLQNYDVVRFSTNTRDFLYWKQTMVKLRDHASGLQYKKMNISTELAELITIMTGYSSAIQESSTSWYESFLAHFLYQMPTMESIQDYIKISLEKNPLDATNSWESICLELFQGNFLSVISSLETLDKSIATFMSILVEASGLLKEYSHVLKSENKINSTIDQMLEELSLTYLTHQEFFAVGVGILISLNNSKTREIIAELLPTYKIKNNDDFEWCLSICAKLKLTKTASRIYKTQGFTLMSQGYLYESLYCFAESGDYPKLINLIWSTFENLLVDGTFQDDVLISKIKSNEIENPILRQALSPFASLYQFLQESQNKEDNIKFSKIFKLLNFNYLPKHYKVVLLLILKPYLNKTFFSLDELISMIRILNDFENELKSDDEVARKSKFLYELALTKTGANINKNLFDWRNESLPNTLRSLIMHFRKDICFEISFKFVD